MTSTLDRARSASLAIGLAGLAFAGCGGQADPETEQAALEAASARAVEFAEAKGTDACGMLTADALDEAGGGSACADELQPIAAAAGVEDASVEGDTAEVQVLNLETLEVSDVELELVDDEWQVAALPGPPRKAPEIEGVQTEAE